MLVVEGLMFDSSYVYQDKNSQQLNKSGMHALLASTNHQPPPPCITGVEDGCDTILDPSIDIFGPFDDPINPDIPEDECLVRRWCAS